MLKADNLSLLIDSKAILRDCSVTVAPGKFTAVVGPNGAGKSTLLKILAGETRKYQGTVELNGKPLGRHKTDELSRARAVLPQQTVVNFPFTVTQVVEIGRYAHPTRLAENDRIVEQAMKMTGLMNFRHRNYQTLSGGEMQRVQMARVIAQIGDRSADPKYLLLDEPTANLDIAQQHSLLSLARDLCDRSVGVMAILHDLNLAIQYADEILFLKNGKTVSYGPLREVVTENTIEETFDHPVRLIEDRGQLLLISNTKRPIKELHVTQTTHENYH